MEPGAVKGTLGGIHGREQRRTPYAVKSPLGTIRGREPKQRAERAERADIRARMLLIYLSGRLS